MSPVKEPAYFSRAHVRDEVRRAVPYMQSEEAYLELFSGATDAHSVIGESSTSYMRSEADLEQLKAFSECPKIIAMVRDPVSLVSSYFHFLRFQGWEPLNSLREAWDIQDERCAGHIESVAANRPDSLAYRNVAQIGHQVERLFRMFGRENVLVLLSDDLRNDTVNVCETVQRFLKLTYMGNIKMPHSNEARAAKMQIFDSLLQTKSHTVFQLKNRLKRFLGLRSLGIRRLLNRYNSTPVQHSISVELRDEMRMYFASDVSLLEKLLDRNLFELWGWEVAGKLPNRVRDVSPDASQ